MSNPKNINITKPISALSVAMATSAVVLSLSFFFGNSYSTARVILAISLAPCAYNLYSNLNKPEIKWVEIFSNLYLVSILIIPGIFQSSNGFFPFYRMSYDETSVTAAAAITLLFCTTFNAGCALAWTLPKQQRANPKATTLSPSAALLLIFGLCLLSLAIASVIGIDKFVRFRREGFGIALDPVNQATIQLSRSLSFCALILSIHLFKGNKSPASIISLFISTAIFGLINFPPALARFILFGYVISMFILFYPTSTYWKKLTSIILYPAGILTILPYIDHLTRGNTRKDFAFSPGNYVIYSGDLDSFQSIINIYNWISRDGVQFGRQLLSSLLFFIPREMWEGKSYPTGAIAALNNGYSYSNISAPIPGELFSDFGWLGLIFAGVATGLIVGAIDRTANSNQGRFHTMALCATLAGFAAILFRGSLMSILGPVALTVLSCRLLSLAETRFQERLPPVTA
jgi:hypothetical protein